jgi:hypothetical protein
VAFALQLGKKHGKTSVRVVEKCSDIPVPVVQYTWHLAQEAKVQPEETCLIHVRVNVVKDAREGAVW